MLTSKKFVHQTMDVMTGLIENAALDVRVACLGDLLDRVTVDGREARRRHLADGIRRQC
jgi:hypothetical protein